mgnify:FL=1
MMVFVILHYNNIKETMECLDSLERFKQKIIVVSNSKDYDNLKKIEKRVDKVIINEENIGFAKANNIGCKYAIEKYKPDFLCVINNDIVIDQKDFLDKVEKLYKKYQFDVLGPKILPDDLPSVNPFPVYDTLEKIEDRIKYTKKLIKIYNSVILRNLLSYYVLIKSKLKKVSKPVNGDKDELGVALHGCALIFSKKYYERYETVFYNETFLYHEEEFLYYRCKHDNLTFLYSPEVELVHKEGRSLDNSFNNNYKKLIFKNKEILKSLQLLEAVYKKGDAI